MCISAYNNSIYLLLKPKKTAQPDGKVRIIGGRWRRRALPVAQVEGLRPTGNRVRETLFNWLMPFLHDARCLDLYAGTGALGLEALSRGASFVQFVERHKGTHRRLADNLRTLDAKPSEYAIQQSDALQFLESLSSSKYPTNRAETSATQNAKHYDIVFMDPPFQSNLWQQSVDLLAGSPVVSNDALIYVESPIETKIKIPPNWREHRSLNAGTINATLYLQVAQP